MKCLLMHKRIEVLAIDLDEATGFIQKIGEIFAPDHFQSAYRSKKEL